MGNVRIDVANFVTISLIAFAGVWLIDRALDKFGLSQFKV